jgi:hypothetical protein
LADQITDIPQFCKEQLHTKRIHQDIGDAFQVFVHELHRLDYPDLHMFPSKGKDGGIDLSLTSDTSRTVFECKHIGNDGFETANKAWKNVASNFEKHLADSCGPTKGQSQYGPWYRTNPPIREYIFCISSLLSNQNQIDQLKQEIVNFFAALTDKHEHLKHLNGISVEVLDWNVLYSRLQQHPHLIFRWFPRTRPQGLVPIDDLPYEGTFRSYLTSEKLAYYSLGQHLKTNPAPMGMNIPDEEDLLNQLEGGETTGLMVTGSGGIGKSRLTLEIGRIAHNKNWVVFRVQTRLKEKALEHLAERIAPDTRVLLLIDYVETQRDFAELVDTLNDLNDIYSLNLRYIANCRTSFYQTVNATSRHKRVDLAPIVKDSDLNWFKEYRLQIVRHILEQSGLEVTEDHMAVCHDIPTLAVFISYLHNIGRQTELSELLKEMDFGTWIAKRVQLSFGEKDSHRDLALLITQFPMPLDMVFHHDQQNQGVLFDALATDGWIENLPADELHDVGMWVTIHDVLADQILLSYFRTIPYTIERFLDELFIQASKMDCLRSTLLTLQRLIDQPELSSLNWLNILGMKIAGDMAAWREVRDMLIRTSLLTTLEIIELLSKYEEFWEGVEKETDFQNALGWNIRWAMKQGESELNSENRSTLNSWLDKATLCAIKNNFILTWGLRFNPEAVCKPALEWIRSHPFQFQTHYLLVAWMECHLPLDDIVFSVQQWTAKFKNVPHLSFVVKAWLDAGGDKKLVQDPIIVWLEEYKTDSKAHFVYQAWLDAGGDKKLIQDSIIVWLEKHKDDLKADFVYKAWLDAGGDKKLVQDHIKAWLEEYKANLEAGFVYKAWLDAGGDKKLIQDHIKAWLEEYKANLEAGFVYKAWLDAGGENKLVRDPITVWLEEHKTDPKADFVYKAWLDAGGEKEIVRDPITIWLEEHKTDPEAHFVYKAWLDAGGDKELVQDPIRAWLEKHKAGSKADFVYKAWLDAGGEFSVVRLSAILWLHHNYDKLEAVYLTKFLAKQRDIPIETVKDILMWCHKFSENEDALWRLTQLRKHLLREELGEELITTSEAVLDSLISRDVHPRTLIRGQINTLFSYLIGASGLRSGQLRNQVDSLLLTWVKNPSSYEKNPKPHFTIQRSEYVHRIIYLLDTGKLTISKDRESLERFLYWVDSWDLSRKSRLYKEIAYLKENYPSPGLWDILKIK